MYITLDGRGYVVRNNFNHNEIAIFRTRQEALMFIQRNSLQRQHYQQGQNLNPNVNVPNNNHWQQQLPRNNQNHGWNYPQPQIYSNFNQPHFISPDQQFLNNDYGPYPQFGYDNSNFNQPHFISPDQQMYNPNYGPNNYNSGYGFNPQLPYDQNGLTNHPNGLNYGFNNQYPNQFNLNPQIPNLKNQQNNYQNNDFNSYDPEMIPNHFVEVDRKPYVSNTEETIAFKKPPSLEEEINFIEKNEEVQKEIKKEEVKVVKNEPDVEKTKTTEKVNPTSKEKHLERLNTLMLDEVDVSADTKIEHANTDEIIKTSDIFANVNFDEENKENFLSEKKEIEEPDFIQGSTTKQVKGKTKKWLWVSLSLIGLVIIIVAIFGILYWTNVGNMSDLFKSKTKIMNFIINKVII